VIIQKTQFSKEFYDCETSTLQLIEDQISSPIWAIQAPKEKKSLSDRKESTEKSRSKFEKFKDSFSRTFGKLRQ
jgi:hypothetical protein